MSAKMRIYKLDAQGREVWHYEGTVLERGENYVLIEAIFARDYPTDYHFFRRGDRMLEWFYTDRGYNVFQMHDADDGRLKGWYCNITRPARLEAEAVTAEDLALDLMVYPNGQTRLLDEDEFEALQLDPASRAQALAALETLLALVACGEEMFHPLKTQNPAMSLSTDSAES
jgi:predicted RNA-binding protein associated with RNAse of E/G family